MVEAAGKRGIKQLIIVFDDAPEQNKELKERGTSDTQRLCLRAVGEPWFEFRGNKKKDCHRRQSLSFGRSVEVPPFEAEFLDSPLKSKLFDGFV